MKKQYIKDIKAGENVIDSFLVTEKNLTYSQKGSPYLNLKLKDRTGEIEGKIWENAVEWDKVFKKGDIVKIRSRAAHYRNTLHLSIIDVTKLNEHEIDISDYIPVAKENIDFMFSSLISIIETVETPCLRLLLQSFFDDAKFASLFKKAPAAKTFHHVYIGGLLEHTLSVTRLLDMVSTHYDGVNRDLLITGGILHDIGKIYEFSFDTLFDYSDEGRLIGHIIMGVEMIDEKIAQMKDFPQKLAIELRHLILSHHGAHEFGSPKRPKTLEAQIVHCVDDLDAKVNAFQGFIEEWGDDESRWTPFHRLLERFIYKG